MVLYSFCRAAVTKGYKLYIFKLKLFSYCSGDEESKIRLWAGPCSLWGSGHSPPLPLPASGGQLPSLPGIPPVPASLVSMVHTLCACLSLPLKGTLVILE